MYPESVPRVSPKVLRIPCRAWVLCVLLSWAAAGVSEAANGTLYETLRRVREGQIGETTPSQGTVPLVVTPPLEAPVDPRTYRLIPGDQVHVGVWGEAYDSQYLAVSPEGDLIVSGLGPVAVRGLTLAEAETRVVQGLRPFYPRGTISLRLLQPGRFRIFVAGMVSHPGVFEVTRMDRLSAVLEDAGGIRSGGSSRRVRVLRTSEAGVSVDPLEFDLSPWILHGDTDANPLLEPGMTVEIPGQGPTVRVRGPVNGRSALELPAAASARVGDRPEEEPDRSVEWKEGDRVGDLLDFVGGISERATGRGVLYREGAPPVALDLNRGEDREVPLRPGDLLEVGYAARWVFVVGSVRSPGRYPFLPDLRVGDYVSMAGGPTELGRASGWTLDQEGENRRKVEMDEGILPGSTIRVPERRTYRVSTILAPLSSAAALILSLVALSR